MQIRPTTNVSNTSAVNLQTQNTTSAVDSNNTLPVDQLEISPEAQMISQTSTSGDIRADRVADIRAQIASGQYESPEKLDAAMNRLFDEIV